MRSRFLDSIKHKALLPFPDIYYSDGFCNLTGEMFDDISELCKNKSIKDFKKGSYTTWKWSGYDDKIKYNENLKKQPQDWYYRKNSLSYTLNSFGYRTKQFDEIDWENSILIFGCSFISGVGVDDEHTISAFLEKELGIQVVNLGVGGSSNQFHIYNSILLSSYYPTPKAVIYSWSGLDRYPFYFKDKLEHRGHWKDNKNQIKKNIMNSVTNNVMSMNIFKSIWENKTTFIEFIVNQNKMFDFIEDINSSENRYFIDTFKFMEKDNFARDLSHYGTGHNSYIAKQLSNILKNKI